MHVSYVHASYCCGRVVKRRGQHTTAISLWPAVRTKYVPGTAVPASSRVYRVTCCTWTHSCTLFPNRCAFGRWCIRTRVLILLIQSTSMKIVVLVVLVQQYVCSCVSVLRSTRTAAVRTALLCVPERAHLLLCYWYLLVLVRVLVQKYLQQQQQQQSVVLLLLHGGRASPPPTPVRCSYSSSAFLMTTTPHRPPRVASSCRAQPPPPPSLSLSLSSPSSRHNHRRRSASSTPSILPHRTRTGETVHHLLHQP